LPERKVRTPAGTVPRETGGTGFKTRYQKVPQKIYRPDSLMAIGVRVKWWGKSPPLLTVMLEAWQTSRGASSYRPGFTCSIEAGWNAQINDCHPEIPLCYGLSGYRIRLTVSMYYTNGPFQKSGPLIFLYIM